MSALAQGGVPAPVASAVPTPLHYNCLISLTGELLTQLSIDANEKGLCVCAKVIRHTCS